MWSALDGQLCGGGFPCLLFRHRHRHRFLFYFEYSIIIFLFKWNKSKVWLTAGISRDSRNKKKDDLTDSRVDRVAKLFHDIEQQQQQWAMDGDGFPRAVLMSLSKVNQVTVDEA